MPIIQSESLLKIPPISHCYYKLVSSLCDQHAECLFRLLNLDQYAQFLSTIQSGFENYDQEIGKLCLETIQSLALQIVRQPAETPHLDEKRQHLQRFLDSLLRDVLTSSSTFSDLFETLAGTIFALISAYPQQFYQLLAQIKEQQQDARLNAAIDQFVQDIGQKHDNQRKAKVSFTNKFEGFVTDLRRVWKK